MQTIFVELDEKTNRDNNATFGVRSFPTFVFLKVCAYVAWLIYCAIFGLDSLLVMLPIVFIDFPCDHVAGERLAL